ncbi:MAG: ABC transporter permease [Solirubrobacteraceae bacterium]
MIGYVIRRVGQSLVIMVIVSIVVFAILHMLPGGLVRAQLGPRATALSVHNLTVQEGLNKPIIVQYGIWAWHALQGNLGFSYKLNQSVASLLGEYMPRDLLLVGVAMLFALAIALPLGVWQGYRRNRPDDMTLSALMMFFYAMPSFLLGVLLIVVFNIWTNLLPSTATNFGTGVGTDINVLILPVLALCLGNVSYFSRYVRSATIDNLLSDHVRTAIAKGAAPRRLLARHVLRNSLSSTITMVGMTLPYVLSGSLIIEALFNFPGMGLLFWNAAQDRDFPVLLGVVLVVTLATVIGNLLADLGYAALDPRVRLR